LVTHVPFNDRLPVIVITAYSEVQAAVRAMKAGAVDFIEKPYRDDLRLNAIEAGLRRAGRTDTARETTDAAKRIAALTPRERQVLTALVGGNPNKVIAFDLGISVRTVEVHRARMMERLGARQLAEVVRLAELARLES
jgi:two-component system response regulator FixJ